MEHTKLLSQDELQLLRRHTQQWESDDLRHGSGATEERIQ